MSSSEKDRGRPGKSRLGLPTSGEWKNRERGKGRRTGSISDWWERHGIKRTSFRKD